MQVEAYMVTSSWEEDTIVWNNKANCHFDEKLTTVNVSTAGRYDFYITQAVMAWKQGIPNYGIMLKARVEQGNVNHRAFFSQNYVTSDSEQMPHLSITYTTDLNYMDNIGVENGTQYYIKNKNSGKYLTAMGSADFSDVAQMAWTGNANQKWTVQCNDYGYYKLIPGNAPDKVLEVYDNGESDYYYNSIMQLYSPENTYLGQQYMFVRNWDGSYQILTRLSNFTAGLYVEDNSEEEGAYILQRPHTVDWVKSDDWTLEAVQKGDADVYSFVYDNLDTTEFVGPMITSLVEMGYDEFDCRNHSAELGYYWLSEDSIWIFTGHGRGSHLDFVDDENNFAHSFITAADTRDGKFAVSEKPHNDLAQLQLALFASCDTGLDEADTNSNLVGMMYRKGAHFTIAHTGIAGFPWDDIWVQRFLEYCEDGKTIYDAMELADDDIYNGRYEQPEGYPEIDSAYGNVMQRHTLGDNSLVLYHIEEGE